MLEWLLDLSDSIITYRARYMGHAEWIAVADLLLFDRRNPRSAAFQIAKLAKHVPLLPGGDLEDLERTTRPDLIDARGADRTLGHRRLSGGSRTARACRCPICLTLRYFSHAYEPAHATLL